MVEVVFDEAVAATERLNERLTYFVIDAREL